ncbi:MAG: Regulator of RpoS [Anaerolineae bacterium]|nr:Regulator of RpoS [Anaerolineae bacterium]
MPDETILVVDDSFEFARTVINYMLIPMGYRTLHAADGKKGLQMAIEYGPDLILLDMNMPRMSGLETLTALRDADCKVPVIFMTMHGSEIIAVNAFRLGVRDYLNKPFSAAELQKVIDAALQESRLTREKEELARNLLMAETIRHTVVTLSHYINNNLMTLTGGLELLASMLAPDNTTGQQIIEDSQRSTKRIGAVLRVLQRITRAELATYHGQVKMIDIEQALRDELAADES